MLFSPVPPFYPLLPELGQINDHRRDEDEGAEDAFLKYHSRKPDRGGDPSAPLICFLRLLSPGKTK